MNQGYGRLRSLLRCVAAGLLGTFVGVAAWGQSSIQSMTAFGQGGGELLRIDFTAPPSALPTGFAIQSPARIALDFPGTANGLGRPSVELNQGNLRSATVVEAGDRTRVVLNLRRPTAYTARIEGNSLLVSLEPSAAGAAALVPRASFAENSATDV